jgi:Ran GTPase-activating protein (RanGAP) involved in mRNA processing and transport
MLFIDHEVELVHLKLEANGVDDFHEDSLAQVCFELPFALPYKLEDHEYE